MSDSTSWSNRTLTAYALHAPAAIASWSRAARPSPWLRKFASLCPDRGLVLDYGCGIGTDLLWLKAQGFEVAGMDGTPAFLKRAARRCPKANLHEVRFESVQLPDSSYDGIWCRASLLHVPPEELGRHLWMFRTALRPGGILGLTLAWGRGASFTDDSDWIPGRYVVAYQKAQVLAWFSRGGWELHGATVVSHDGRDGRWVQILASPAGVVV